jgi:hypothetical protein
MALRSAPARRLRERFGVSREDDATSVAHHSAGGGGETFGALR